MRVREAEDSDHGVADELFQDTAMLGNDFTGDIVVAAEQDADILGIERIAERGRSRHIGEEDGHDAALFSHGRLPLEETDTTATAIAIAAACGHHTDAAVVFENRLFDLVDLVNTVLADGHLDIGLAEPLFIQRRLADLAILDDHSRRRLDQRIEPEPAAPQHRDGAVEDQKNGDDDRAPGNGLVRARNRRLQRIGDQQDQDEVEGRELSELALAEEAQADEEDHVDDDGSENEGRPWDTQLGDIDARAHARRILVGYRMPEPEVEEGRRVSEMLRAPQHDDQDGPPVARRGGGQAVAGGTGVAGLDADRARVG